MSNKNIRDVAPGAIVMPRHRSRQTQGHPMTSPVPSPSQAAARAPQFGATVVYGRYTEIKLTQLIQALRTIAPLSVMGDWSGPFAGPPTDALGTDLLSIDGVSLT